jgi:hypothetical protein
MLSSMFTQTHFPAEECVAELVLEAIPGCGEEARLQYASGLAEDTGKDSLAE